MKYGYSRVSTQHQKLDLQIDALKKAGCDIIVSEKISSRKRRLELEKLLLKMKANDTLIVFKLDRLGRSLKELVNIVSSLEEKGIGFVSISDQIDTNSPCGRLLFHMLCAISSFEIDILRERTKAGISAARDRGKKIGRPKGLSTEAQKVARKVKDLRDNSSLTVLEICDSVGISKPTYYRYLAR